MTIPIVAKAMKRILRLPRFARVLPFAATIHFAAIASVAAEDKSVLTYHADPTRGGNYVVPELSLEKARTLHIDEGFRASFHGHVYAQPLYWRTSGNDPGLIIVATEENGVFALDASTGKTVWQRALGTPVQRSSLKCGDIDPVGITGTPVLDEKSRAIYLDAFLDSPSGPRHKVFALSLRDGSIREGWPVDVGEALRARGYPFNPADQNQRSALLLLNGTVYVPFGGHFGDCGNYHGLVVGLSTETPRTARVWSTRGAGGGIWAPGGVSSDGEALYAATGNTLNASSWSDGEAVFRLAPDLHRTTRSADYFVPRDWRDLDARDADLGGTNPLPLELRRDDAIEALVLALGKDGRAYLLDRHNLGGVGGALLEEAVSQGPIRTSPATYPVQDGAVVVFQGQGVHCPNRSGDLTALHISTGKPPRMSVAWCGAMRGRGAPIVTTTDERSNPIVWIVGSDGDDRLHGFRGDNGEAIFESQDLPGLHRFQTLIAAAGHLYVAADGRVFAFSF